MITNTSTCVQKGYCTTKQNKRNLYFCSGYLKPDAVEARICRKMALPDALEARICCRKPEPDTLEARI